MTTFRDLKENLRQELLRRIEDGHLTQTLLASQTGFQQAHISNYLSGRRALSLEGLDRMLTSQKISVFDLLPPAEHSIHGSVETEQVPVVDNVRALSLPTIISSASHESIECPAQVLRSLRRATDPDRISWTRFTAIRITAPQAKGMAPPITEGSLAVIDRHYTHSDPYRDGQLNVYAVRVQNTVMVRCLEEHDQTLILRPQLTSTPVMLLPALRRADNPVIGRLCWVITEI
jgi:hypothetical protein